MERRSFLKMSGALGTAAVVTGCDSSSSDANVVSPTPPPLAGEVVNFSSCTGSCGYSCLIKVMTRDGIVTRLDTDDFGSNEGKERQSRACLKGRSLRQKIYSPTRLKTPMKRIGKRGEGKFEPISWDEAYSLIASELRRIIDTYGNEAVHYQQCTSSNTYRTLNHFNMPNAFFNTLGGSLQKHDVGYSYTQIFEMGQRLFGNNTSFATASDYWTMKDSDFILSFGFNPAENRMSGIGGQYMLATVCGNTPTVVVDPRFSDSTIAPNTDWLPIRPGTDAALCEAIIFTLVTRNLHDKAFLDKYCVGFDEDTLPVSAPPKSDYKSHILGEGEDGFAKTPDWASRITGIPAEKIIELAERLSNSDRPFIMQGWGPQRHAIGEETVRSIYMLPLVLGRVGLPGTNNGNMPSDRPTIGKFPKGVSAVKTSIPFLYWVDAIRLNGPEVEKLTAKEHGLRNAEELTQGIKFLWVAAGNPVNQHPDTNETIRALEDDSLCEFIVVHDIDMVATAKYADIILPDRVDAEQSEITSNPSSDMEAVIRMTSSVVPNFEPKDSYEIFSNVARLMGVEEAFTQGKTREEWLEHIYTASIAVNPNLPSYEELTEKQYIRVPRKGYGVVFKDFIDDPEGHPLATPSGKFEIYSETLAQRAKDWVLPEGQMISPIPRFYVTHDSYLDEELKSRYPLQCFSWKTKRRQNSSFGTSSWLKDCFENALWINPIDAAERQISEGDTVAIYNDRGTVQMPVVITPRIIPGAVCMPTGGHYIPDNNGVDTGGCMNVLTLNLPTPISKGNPQHTNLVEVVKA